MATMRTEITGKETNGEKRLFYIFRDRFSDDYHVWHNVVFHKNSTEIDFIIVHPSEGIYIIEVKDWSVGNIKKADASRVYYDVNGQVKSLENPLEQARNNSYFIKNELEKKSIMQHKSGENKFKLVTPVNYGIAFPNISSEQIVANGFENHLPPNKILDQSFYNGEAYIDRDFEKALDSLRKYKFSPLIEIDQWNAINEFLGTPVVKNPSSSETIGVFDDIQENLVKYKIEEQITIEGPAGSGKSLILVKRAAYMLQQNPEWKIGVFCFNALMANYLRTLFAQEEILDKMVVSHFAGYSNWKINRNKFDAVLIDEGQDCESTHLLNVFSLLNPETASFTIFHDPLQAIYQRSNLETLLHDSGFNISCVKQLVRQQRSVLFITALGFYNAMTQPEKSVNASMEETFSLAQRYFHGYDNPITSIASGSSRHFSTQKNIKIERSLQVEIKQSCFIHQEPDASEMIYSFKEIIQSKVSSGEAVYNDFLIIYPIKFFGYFIPSKIKRAFLESSIPFRYVDKKNGECCTFDTENAIIWEEGDNRKSTNLNESVVLSTTIHQSKGLDAKYVAIIGFENIISKTLTDDDASEDDKRDEIFRAASLGYVALSRATKEIYVYFTTYNKPVSILVSLLTSMKRAD